jgi:nucleolin
MTKDIYVEGLPFDISEDAVKELFSGTIVRSVIPRWHDSGRLRGYAIIEFETEAEAQEALSLDKKKLESGRYLSVSFSKGKKTEFKPQSSATEITADEQSTCKTMFVGNLPYDVTEDELSALFTAYGPIEEVRVVSENGRTKGFGYLEFKKAGIVKRIVSDAQKKKLSMKGRALNVDFNTGQKRAGFHLRKEAYDSAHFKKDAAAEAKKKNIVKRI